MRSIRFADKYVQTPGDIPTGEHWAIITGTSVSVPGDERSRTNPGHGYPAHTANYIQYAAYYDQAKFKEALALAIEQERRFGGQQVRGIHVLGTYSSKVEVVEDRTVVR